MPGTRGPSLSHLPLCNRGSLKTNRVAYAFLCLRLAAVDCPYVVYSADFPCARLGGLSQPLLIKGGYHNKAGAQQRAVDQNPGH